jgi:hypothetical protein
MIASGRGLEIERLLDKGSIQNDLPAHKEKIKMSLL